MTTPSNQQPEATPGPWVLDENNECVVRAYHKGGPGRYICHTETNPGSESKGKYARRRKGDEGNARLIADAPRLLSLVSKSRALLHEIRQAADGMPMYLYNEVQQLINEIDGGQATEPELGPTGIEKQICEEITQRQQMGIQKYGTTLADNKLSHKERLQHAKEEALDLAMYLQKEINEIDAAKGGEG